MTKKLIDLVLNLPDKVDRALQELKPEERLFVEQWNGDIQETWEAIREISTSKKFSFGALKRMASDIRIVRAIRIYNSQNDPGIANKNERQQFWSSVIHDETQRMADRLKASELLGKSCKDFVEQVEISATTDFAKAIADARQRASKTLDTTAEVTIVEDPFE